MKNRSLLLVLALVVIALFSSCTNDSEQLDTPASVSFCSDFRELTALDGGKVWDANAETKILLYRQLINNNQNAAPSLLEATEHLVNSTDQAGTPEYGVAFGSVGLLCIGIDT